MFRKIVGRIVLFVIISSILSIAQFYVINYIHPEVSTKLAIDQLRGGSSADIRSVEEAKNEVTTIYTVAIIVVAACLFCPLFLKEKNNEVV